MHFSKLPLIFFILICASGSALAGGGHKGAAVSVPVDSPWAIGALGALLAVFIARAIRKR